MAKRKIRLDEDSLIDLLTAGLRDAGYLNDGSKIVALEYRTRSIKAEGDYYKDLAEPGYDGPIELVKWIRVLTTAPEAKPREDNDTD